MSVRSLDEAHRKALIRVGEDLLERLKTSRPDVYEKLVADAERLTDGYGVPSLGGSFGGLWDSDCSRYVADLLNLSNQHGRPLRIVVEPEPFDGDAHHWTVTYEWLEWDERKGWVPLRELEQQCR